MAYWEDIIYIKKKNKVLKRNSTFFKAYAYFILRSDVSGL